MHLFVISNSTKSFIDLVVQDLVLALLLGSFRLLLIQGDTKLPGFTKIFQNVHREHEKGNQQTGDILPCF